MKRFFRVVAACLLAVTILMSLPFQSSALAAPRGDDGDGRETRTVVRATPGESLREKLRADADVARNVGDDAWANTLDNIADRVDVERTSAEEAFDIGERANSGDAGEAMSLTERASRD
jgi:hypothetical protein